MFEAYGDPARKVIFLARFEAGRLKSDTIDTQHLLLGFILEDQGVSRSELHKRFGIAAPESLNVTEPEPREAFLDPAIAKKLQAEFSTFGPLADPQPTHADIRVGKRAGAVLSAAFEHANGGLVTPLHLLWGLLDDQVDAVAGCLVENGITRERIENAIRSRGAPTLRRR